MEASLESTTNTLLQTVKQTAHTAINKPSNNFVSITNYGYPMVHNAVGSFKTIVPLNQKQYYIEGTLQEPDDDGNSYGKVTTFQEVVLVEPSQVALAASTNEPDSVSTLVYVCFGHLDSLSEATNTDYITDCFKDGYFRIGDLMNLFNQISNH
jgi:hypothetical protein